MRIEVALIEVVCIIVIVPLPPDRLLTAKPDIDPFTSPRITHPLHYFSPSNSPRELEKRVPNHVS